MSFSQKGHPDTWLDLRSGWKPTWRERLWLLSEISLQPWDSPPRRRLSSRTISLQAPSPVLPLPLSRGLSALIMQLSRALTGSITRMKQRMSERREKICKFVDNYFISLQVPPPSEGLLSLCHTLKVIFWWYSLPGLLSKEAAQSVVTGMIKHESWALLLEQINQIWLGRKFCTELPGDIGNKKPSISG